MVLHLITLHSLHLFSSSPLFWSQLFNRKLCVLCVSHWCVVDFKNHRWLIFVFFPQTWYFSFTPSLKWKNNVMYTCCSSCAFFLKVVLIIFFHLDVFYILFGWLNNVSKRRRRQVIKDVVTWIYFVEHILFLCNLDTPVSVQKCHAKPFKTFYMRYWISWSLLNNR